MTLSSFRSRWPRGGSERPGRVGREGCREVWVPVVGADGAAVAAVGQAVRIPAARHRAVHVARDRVAGVALAVEWMERGLPVPLLVVDHAGGLAASIRTAVESGEVGGAGEVVVALSRDVFRRGWWRLPRWMVDQVVRDLAEVPGVRVVVLASRVE